VDEAVAAVRRGDAIRAIALAEVIPGRSALAGLRALMVRSGHSDLLDYVRQKLVGDPPLIHERYASRTLLHEAAAAGNRALVELLLTLGGRTEYAGRRRSSAAL